VSPKQTLLLVHGTSSNVEYIDVDAVIVREQNRRMRFNCHRSFVSQNEHVDSYWFEVGQRPKDSWEDLQEKKHLFEPPPSADDEAILSLHPHGFPPTRSRHDLVDETGGMVIADAHLTITATWKARRAKTMLGSAASSKRSRCSMPTFVRRRRLAARMGLLSSKSGKLLGRAVGIACFGVRRRPRDRRLRDLLPRCGGAAPFPVIRSSLPPLGVVKVREVRGDILPEWSNFGP
jgi:hypothetical protein